MATYSAEYYQKNKERLKQKRREYYAANRESTKASQRRYNAANKDAIRERNRRWVAANREKKKAGTVAWRRKKLAGFDKPLFAERLALQHGKCAICARQMGPDIPQGLASADHCHETNTPRGILCRRCNLLLGHAKDSVETLEKAIEYLKHWKRTA